MSPTRAQLSKRIISIAIGVGAMATLGGVALAAAHTVDTTPPPAYIPGVGSTNTAPTTAGSAAITPSTTIDDHGTDATTTAGTGVTPR